MKVTLLYSLIFLVCAAYGIIQGCIAIKGIPANTLVINGQEYYNKTFVDYCNETVKHPEENINYYMIDNKATHRWKGIGNDSQE